MIFVKRKTGFLPYADDPRWVGTVAADGPHKVQDKIGARSVQKFMQTRAIPPGTVGPFRPEARPLPFVEPSRLCGATKKLCRP